MSMPNVWSVVYPLPSTRGSSGSLGWNGCAACAATRGAEPALAGPRPGTPGGHARRYHKARGGRHRRHRRHGAYSFPSLRVLSSSPERMLVHCTILLRFTGPPVLITARIMHSPPQMVVLCTLHSIHFGMGRVYRLPVVVETPPSPRVISLCEADTYSFPWHGRCSPQAPAAATQTVLEGADSGTDKQPAGGLPTTGTTAAAAGVAASGAAAAGAVGGGLSSGGSWAGEVEARE
eukprot:7535499-Pyramimonas_sp.AAC.1